MGESATDLKWNFYNGISSAGTWTFGGRPILRGVGLGKYVHRLLRYEAEFINQNRMRRTDCDCKSFILMALVVRGVVCFVSIVVYLLVSFFYDSTFYICALLIPVSILSICGQKILADGKVSLYAKFNCLSLMIGVACRLYGLWQGESLSFYFRVLIAESTTSIVFEVIYVLWRSDFHRNYFEFSIERRKSISLSVNLF